MKYEILYLNDQIQFSLVYLKENGLESGMEGNLSLYQGTPTLDNMLKKAMEHVKGPKQLSFMGVVLQISPNLSQFKRYRTATWNH